MAMKAQRTFAKRAVQYRPFHHLEKGILSPPGTYLAGKGHLPRQGRLSALFYIFHQLTDLKGQADTLLARHTGIGISRLQVGLQFMPVFFQINCPGLPGIIIIYLNIDPALT
jgi:hypothetical protein